MLPNLRYLQVTTVASNLNGFYLIVWQCNVQHALVLLPQASKTLIRLSLLDAHYAQGPYLLRKATPEGVFPALRSLGICRNSFYLPKPRKGDQWREDENGEVSHLDAEKPREFDGNYIMSISKAAPNLEELELMGTSDDTLVSLLSSFYLLFVCSMRSQCRTPSPPPYP